MNESSVRRDVVLRSHHDIIDGIGTLMLLNNLFTHAALIYESDEFSPMPFGDEFKNLSPSFMQPVSLQLPAKRTGSGYKISKPSMQLH